MIESNVSFYNTSEGAIRTTLDRLKTPTDFAKPMFMDLFLFSCLFFRQMRNLGNHPTIRELYTNVINKKEFFQEFNDSVSDNKILVLKHHIVYFAALSLGLSIQDAENSFGGELYLVNYRGKGKVNFNGVIKLNNNNPMYTLNIKGIGPLGQGANLYAPDSIALNIKHIIKVYGIDIIDIIESLSQDCMKIMNEGLITMLNQASTALLLVKKYI